MQSLQGFAFVLKSSTPNKPDHTLWIRLQTSLTSISDAAFIEGSWQGDGEPKRFTGAITGSPTDIVCAWGPNGMGGQNTLIGKLSPVVTRPALPREWQLNGTVVVTDSSGAVVSGGPGMVSGIGEVKLVNV